MVKYLKLSTIPDREALVYGTEKKLGYYRNVRGPYKVQNTIALYTDSILIEVFTIENNSWPWLDDDKWKYYRIEESITIRSIKFSGYLSQHWS